MVLSHLAKKYKCAKNNHIHNNVYLVDIYHQYFEKIRDQKISFLEIGVYTGASISMWLEYFKNISLYMIDIDPTTKKFERNGVEIFIGSQDDKKLIGDLTNKCNKFDVILDDGSHINELTLKSFDLLWSHVKPGGLYIIEDTHCSYDSNIMPSMTDSYLRKNWPGMKYNPPELKCENKREDVNKFLLEKIYELDLNHKPKVKNTNIFSIHIYSKSIIIQKNK